MPSSATDSIQFAAELGRLDFLSAVLASLAAILVFVSLPYLLYLRHRAEQVAKKTAEEVLANAKEEIEKRAAAMLEAMLPTMVRDYMDVAESTAIGSVDADEIAASQEEPDGDDFGGGGARPANRAR